MSRIWNTVLSYKSLILLLALTGLLSACQDRIATGRTTPTPSVAALGPQSPTPESLAATPTLSQEDREMPVNRIAYISADGNLFTIRPDGTDSRKLTSNDLRVGPPPPVQAQIAGAQVFYAWPTWSPDGNSLAVSQVTVEREAATFTLEVVDSFTGRVTKIYDNEPNTSAIARGAPHYMSWSADSKQLVFIASTFGGLSLFSTDIDKGTGPVPLLQEGPLYLTWATQTNSLVIHRGEELIRAFPDDSGQQTQSLGVVGTGFRTPALSPDGRTVAYAAKDAGGDALFVAEARPRLEGSRAILDVGHSAALLWSPSRDEIAVADTSGESAAVYDRLTIISSDGASQTTVAEESLLAFFWSPDGEMIAYVAYDVDAEFFTWKLVARSGGAPVKLAEFTPSMEFLTLLTFFDQYAQSNGIWSPDSSMIVYSGTPGPGAGRRNGASPETERAYVLEAREGAAPREIATSRFAVWSWG